MTQDFSSQFQSRFKKSSGRVLITSRENEVFTYEAMWANANAIAETWHAEGIREGDIVALQLPNCVALLCCYLACAAGGFIACPILDSHHPDLQAKLLSLTKPALVVKKIPSLNSALKWTGDYIPKMEEEQRFFIAFSSGLTGDPKAIVHSWKNIIGSASSFARITAMGEDSVLYHILPMAYMAGILNTFFAPMMAGAHIIEGPLFSPLSMINFFQRPSAHDVSIWSITPTIAAALCRIIEKDGHFLAEKAKLLKSLRQVQCTSAPISLRLAKQFQELFSIPLQNCYGMTEIGGPLTFQTLEDANAQAPFSSPIAELEILFKNSNELWLRSPFLMKGYLQGDGSLQDMRDENGFMNTGDTALVELGRLQITGRKKDIIIRGGVNISPLRLESTLSLVAGVEELAAFGVEHHFWGEAIVVCVVPKHGASVTVEDVMLFAHQNLGAYERPDSIFIMESLPRNTVGKIHKGLLKEQIKERMR